MYHQSDLTFNQVFLPTLTFVVVSFLLSFLRTIRMSGSRVASTSSKLWLTGT